MKRTHVLSAVWVLALSVGAAGLGAAPAATASGVTIQRACNAPAPGYAACFAVSVRGGNGFQSLAVPAGYHPADLRSAYGLDASKGAAQKIAIIDAFDNPKAEADLGVYRSTFGLPACTTANGCFKKVNQNGQASPLPVTDAGWGLEIALDVDMASAICPKCKILLVEATNNSFANLAAAVDRAAILGATVISNSYGGAESSGAVGFASHYNHPGIPITVSSGDGGFAARAQAPASFATVTAVGGTTLKHATNTRGWKETVWSGAGSGCSAFIAKPAWQTDTACKKRMVADVSAVADPNTGVSVYDTFGVPGWVVVGGTSASAPIVAGVYALAGNGASINNASYIYAHIKLYDVKKGSNGSCGGSYFCTAKAGYDGPTGLGTPKGSKAF